MWGIVAVPHLVIPRGKGEKRKRDDRKGEVNERHSEIAKPCEVRNKAKSATEVCAKKSRLPFADVTAKKYVLRHRRTQAQTEFDSVGSTEKMQSPENSKAAAKR